MCRSTKNDENFEESIGRNLSFRGFFFDLYKFIDQFVVFSALISPTTTTCLTDTDIRQIFTSNINSPLYVGIYGNSDLSNSDSRVEVIRCLSEIGSSDRPTCETGTFPSVSSGQCYVRLDIQIGYANTGAVTNPQQIIGTVVFHYQRLVSSMSFPKRFFRFCFSRQQQQRL